MTTVLLVRHGRSTSNASGTLSGRLPGVVLDETGRSQAMRVGERLRGLQLAAVVRSPLERCEQTAELCLASSGIDTEVLVDDRLTECDYGQWSGRSLAELAGEAAWATIQRAPSTVTFPGGESMSAMAARTVAAVEDWNRRLGDDAVWLLVGHGDPIKAVLSHALGQHLDDFQRIVVDPASVSMVSYGPDRAPLVLAMNTTSGPLRELAAVAPQRPQLGGGLGNQGADDQSPTRPA